MNHAEKSSPNQLPNPWPRGIFIFSCLCLAIGMYGSFSVAGLGLGGILLATALAAPRVGRVWSSSHLPLLVLLLVSGLSILVNFESMQVPVKNFLKLKYFAYGLGVSMCLQLYFGSLGWNKDFLLNHFQKKTLITLFFSATTLASLVGLYALFSGYNPLRMQSSCHYLRACGMYGHFISYGYGIYLVVLFLFGLLVFRKEVSKYISTKFLALCFVINLMGLYFSYTRGAILGLIICAPFFFFNKKKLRKFFLVFGGLVAIFLVALSMSWTLRFSFFDIHRVRSNDIRLSMYKTALMALKEKPLLGLGYKNFEPNSKRLKEKYQIEIPEFASHAHSNYFEALASTGFIGFFSLLSWLGSWLVQMYRREDWWGKLMFPMVLGVIVTGATQYTLGDGETMIGIMSLYGISQIKWNEFASASKEEMKEISS